MIGVNHIHPCPTFGVHLKFLPGRAGPIGGGVVDGGALAEGGVGGGAGAAGEDGSGAAASPRLRFAF